jgi:hypothetical protein
MDVEMVFRDVDARRFGLSMKSSFPCPMLVIRALPRVSVQATRKRKGRSTSRAARQTASIVAIHPSPLTRGLPPSPGGTFSPAGTESHKTSMSLKKLLACFASDMLQLFDFDLRPYRSNESV